MSGRTNRTADAAHQYSARYQQHSMEEPLDANTQRIPKYQSNKESTAGQSTLPLQWIDEQELRRNKSGLRKTVRSYARRDTCLRQQRKNAASKPKSKALRSIIEKSGSDDVELPPGYRSHAESQLSPSRTSQFTQLSHPCRVPQNPTVDRNKSNARTAGNDPSDNDLAVNTAKDQCKSSVGRHPIRSVPVCKSRSLRRKQVLLPDSRAHEFPRKANTGLSHQEGLENQSSAQTAKALHPPSLSAKNSLLYGSWKNDAFDVYGIVNNPRASLLLNHHQEAIGSTWRPHINRAFLEWNLSSEVLLHGLLYFAASHLYNLTNCTTLRYDILHHKGEVLRLINQQLEDPVERVSDTTIGALAFLIIHEEMYGSKDTAAFHREGLRKLLYLRKDIPGQELNYFILKMLPITGVQYNYQGDVPMAGEVSPVIDRTSQSTIHSREPVPLVEVTIPGNAMYEVFVWLKNSARLVSRLAPDAPNRKKESYLIRTKIQSYLSHLDENPDFENRDCTRCWLTASLIYIHTVTATTKELEMLHVTELELVQQLRLVLETLIVSQAGFNYSCPVFLWVLLLGRLPARDTDALWFNSIFAQACTAAKIETWYETKELLHGLPWVERNLEQKLRALCPFDDKN